MARLLIYGAVNALCPALKPDILIQDVSTAITGAIQHSIQGTEAMQCPLFICALQMNTTHMTHMHQRAVMGT